MIETPDMHLPPETAFLVDFNLHMVPAALGLAVPDDAAASMFSTTPEQIRRYTAAVDRRVRLAAFEMLSSPDDAFAIDRLSLPEGGLVMAIGDSITTYRWGYARLLAAMLELRRPLDQLRFLNLAQSGYTSTHGLETTYTQFLAHQPDWVLIKFGVNDCKQFGDPLARTLVSLDEYRANLAAIVAAFQRFTPARIILLSPTPVVESIVNSYPDFAPMRMTWDNRNLKACADAVGELAAQHGLTFVDLFSLFDPSPDPVYYLPDGLHPGPSGHKLMARRVLRVLDNRQ